MRIRLSDADRERLGCDEWLSVDLGRMTNREAAAIQQAYGFNDHVEVAEAFNAQWIRDGEDKPVDLRYNYDAWDSVTWLALRQAGVLTGRSRTEVAAELGGLEYQVVAIRIEGDKDDDEGKDASSTPDRTSPT